MAIQGNIAKKNILTSLENLLLLIQVIPSGAKVINVLERLAEMRGLPEVITLNKGTEFAEKVLDEWAYRKGVKLSFIRSGKLIENAFAESFNGRLRDECLNDNWFFSIRHAKEVIELGERIILAANLTDRWGIGTPGIHVNRRKCQDPGGIKHG